MFLLPGKVLFLLPLLFSSCMFADLRPVGISTVPEGPWAVLDGEYSPVILIFDTEMEKPSVERSIQIISSNGAVEGDIKWEGKNLYFIPAVSWKPGLRYGLKVSGTITAIDGREASVSMDIPFFAVSRSPLPYVKSFFPADGMSVGISNKVILELNFSRPMDRLSVEDALKFEIPGDKVFRWQDDDSSLLISSALPLNPWIAYRWSISDAALSREGAPLSKEFSGRFTTDLERDFISVKRIIPLMPPDPFLKTEPSGLWGTWLPSGPGMETGPGYGHGIGVEFSKTADSESLRRAFSFTPSLPGRVEILSPVSAVFIPSKDMESGTVYEIRISGAVKDAEGLKMGNDYVSSFKSDIPFLYITSVSFINGGEISSPSPGRLFQIPVSAGGIARCIINFSLSFDTGVHEETAFKISLRPFFPGTLPPVSLRSARWLSPDRLLMEWEGPEAGESSEANFYKLLIPNTTHNGRGSYLKEDFFLYLEAKHE